MFLNAGRLFRHAVETCQAIPPAPMGQHEREALSSIVLAVISCESFINELPEIAKQWSSDARRPGWLKAVTQMLEQAEQSRASIESKYQLAKFIFTAEPFDKGAMPFQDFALLIEVRNILIHAKPLEVSLERDDNGEFVWKTPLLMRRLQAARIVGVAENLKDAVKRNNADKLIADMLSQISSKAVALWACRTASATVNAVLNSVPSDSSLARYLEHVYRKDFQSPSAEREM